MENFKEGVSFAQYLKVILITLNYLFRNMYFVKLLRKFQNSQKTQKTKTRMNSYQNTLARGAGESYHWQCIDVGTRN